AEESVGSVPADAVTRTNIGARRGEVGLESVAAINRDRAATTEGCDCIRAVVQSPDRVSRIVDARRILHCGTAWPRTLSGDHSHDTSRALHFDGRLQSVC